MNESYGTDRSYNKIFNVGLNRAGTASLSEALRILGFRAVHFKIDGRRVYDIWRHNAVNGRPLLSGLADRFDAFSDFAAYGIFEILDRQYPHSKFIVTLRELKSWLASRDRKVNKNRADSNYSYGFYEINHDRWISERQQFLQRINAYFQSRPGDLLTIDIPAGEGWDELCEFLDLPVPNAEFPFRNRLASTASD